VVAASAGEVFVGRAALLQAIIGTPPQGEARFADASGIPGIGKTEFIKHIAAFAHSEHGITALPLFVDTVSAPTNLADAYNTFVDHLTKFAARLGSWTGRASLVGDFDNELAAIEQRWTQLEVTNTVNAESATITSDLGNVSVGFGGLEGGIYGAKRRATVAAFAAIFGVAFKRKPLLVTVDGYDEVAGTPVGEWLLDVLGRLPNTLVVLGRTSVARAPTVAPDRTLSAELTLFSREEVATLLAEHLGSSPGDALVDAVCAWSEGHPGTAAIAAKFLRTLDDPQAATIAARLAVLPTALEAERAKLAVEFMSSLGGAAFVDIAEACAATRVFDEELLSTLLNGPVPDGAIDLLRVAGIVESVGDADAATFRVHTFIREPLLQLAKPGVRKRLHQRAAAHEYELLCQDEPELDGDARPYESWYRYEKPEWQARLREWLHHQREGAQTENEIRRARLKFVRIFLDAFWWWGCYVEFPFCRDLIADWERARSDDGEWLTDLRTFLDAYPTGARKQDATGWIDVEAALIGARRECGIDGNASAITERDARHTRALIDNFLAHACRYRACADDGQRHAHYGRAIGYYAESAALLERGGESWELAWTLFETAELHADNAQHDTARIAWRSAVAAALDEEDYELTANLHRLRADIHWHEKQQADAFSAHGRAVLHAYFFQSMTPSHRPDAYTVLFYLEQVERVFERLRGLDAPTLAAAVETLRAPFDTTATADEVSAALAGTDPHALAGLLFPPAPQEDELLATRSALTRRIDLLAEQLGGEVAHDLAVVES